MFQFFSRTISSVKLITKTTTSFHCLIGEIFRNLGLNPISTPKFPPNPVLARSRLKKMKINLFSKKLTNSLNCKAIPYFQVCKMIHMNE
jgi:hypothetical protein